MVSGLEVGRTSCGCLSPSGNTQGAGLEGKRHSKFELPMHTCVWAPGRQDPHSVVTAVPPKPRSRLAWSRVHLHVGESHRRCPTQRQAPGTGAEAEGGVPGRQKEGSREAPPTPPATHLQMATYTSSPGESCRSRAARPRNR